MMTNTARGDGRKVPLTEKPWVFNSLRNPTPEELNSPRFNAIWEAIKDWDIDRKDATGRSGATGTDVCTIMYALDCQKRAIHFRICHNNAQGVLMRCLGAVSRRGIPFGLLRNNGGVLELELIITPKFREQLLREWTSIIGVLYVGYRED